MRERDIIWTNQGEAARAEIAAIYGLAGDAVEAAQQSRPALAGIFDTIHAHAPDCPDKAWRGACFRASINSAAATKWKAKALGIDSAQRDVDVALSGMTPYRVGERLLLAVAYPAPKPLARPQPVDELVLIDPQTGRANLYGDDDRLLTGIESEHIVVTADAMAWARELATIRLEWLYRRRHARRVANIEPVWTGLPSTSLAIGDLTRIRWPLVDVITAASDIDHKRLVAAVRRQYHLPRVQITTETRRAA